MSKAWTDEQKREARFRRFVDTNRELIESLMDKTEFLKTVRGMLKIGDGRYLWQPGFVQNKPDTILRI